MVKWTCVVVAVVWWLGGAAGCDSPDRDVIEVPVDLSPGTPLPDPGDLGPPPAVRCALRVSVSSPDDCGKLESYDLTGCDLESLKGLDTSGPFNARFHDTSTAPTRSFDQLLSRYYFVDPEAAHPMFLVSTADIPGRPYSVMAELGCRAEGTDRVLGCDVSCEEGTPPRVLSFESVRTLRRPGEAESSGGLRLIGEAATGANTGLAVDVYVTKGHAYVVSIDTYFSGEGGLFVFDLADRTAPRLVNSITHPDDAYWNGVWAKDDALYVASAARGVLVFDLSDPASPRLIKDLSGGMRRSTHTLFVNGNRLYAMDNGDVLIFDVTNAREPVLLGSYRDESSRKPGRNSYPHDATSLNHLLFVNHWGAGLLILDARDPANVKKLGAYEYPNAMSHYSRVAYFQNNLIAFEGGEGWGAHLRVLNLNDPAKPTLIGEYKLSDEVSIHNMELVGNRLYLAHFQHGVRVLDVTVPSRPREIAYHHTWREHDPVFLNVSPWEGAVGVRVPGDGYVYVVDSQRGLLVFPEL
ncbi:hypothetical protein MFUL124B02_24215 [Myxococcus fulvus 124B02]|nr:hypothetical protein MFUL124B02_24215 [Myxococcus fulvus 124B02]